MPKLVSAERISLKQHPEIKEDHIQQFIFDNPSVLGLGELTAVRREKVQPSGGRLDILLQDEETDTRYEVEIMLGATDPSHIIRTIEYWDSEKKRYPQYDHCAVIVAEEITGRFMNVISLFNGAIPLIALQMSATKHGDDINLSFVKVIDRIIPGTDEEDEDEPADRSYWEKKTNCLSIIDKFYDDVKEMAPEYELKYSKTRIGLRPSGRMFNRFVFYPKRYSVVVSFKTEESQEVEEMFSNSELIPEYRNKSKGYKIRLRKEKDYVDNKEAIKMLMKKVLGTMEEQE